MIERFDSPKILAAFNDLDGKLGGDGAAMSTVERAYLECGCCVYVGYRLDANLHEPAAFAFSCDERHTPLIERYQEMFLASLAVPMETSAVEVANELLERAFAETLVRALASEDDG